MTLPAIVVLSDHDVDVVALPAACTTSKDREKAGYDHGGWDYGVARADAGAFWLDRPYRPGAIDRTWMVSRCRAVTSLGGWCQAGNEPRQEWPGGLRPYCSWLTDCLADYPEGNWVLAPLGAPDTDGWRADLADPGYRALGERIGRVAVHAYGDAAQMTAAVDAYLAAFPTAELVVTEFNPGAGNTFNLDQWAESQITPFLDRCARSGRVKMAAYFAQRWDQSPTLPSSVDAAGTTVPDVLRAWVSPPIAAPDPITVPATPAERPAGMHFVLQYREGRDVPEANVDQVAALCHRWGIGGISPKAMDGDAFMADRAQIPDADTDPILGIRTLDDVVNQKAAYAALGLDYLPWVVPRGFDVRSEAEAHAAVANACGGVVVDFEWLYAGFWGKRGDGSDIFVSAASAWSFAVDYFRALRHNAPTARIVLQPDPRQVENGDYDVRDIAPFFDLVAPQTYWPAFGVSWAQVYNAAENAEWGKPLTYTLYSSDGGHAADPAGTDEFLTHAAAAIGDKPVFVFQRVGLTDALGAVLLAHAGVPPVAAPTDPVAPPVEAPVVPAPRTPEQDEYELACSMIFRGIELVRAYAGRPTTPAAVAADNRADCGTISAAMESIKERVGIG